MKRALMLSLTLSTVALAQDITVKTNRGAVTVKRAGGAVQVKTNKGTDVRVETDGKQEEVTGVELSGIRSDAWMVDGQDKRLTHACARDEDVNVTGQDNDITLTGPCRHVQVSGQDNRVTTEQATSINASGMKNTVTWRRGPSREQKPRISTSGFDNSVSRQE